jgi:hypothetical protein
VYLISYGVLFINSFLGASDLTQIYGSGVGDRFGLLAGVRVDEGLQILDDSVNCALFISEGELWNETSFKIYDEERGLNMDLMSYAMYKRVKEDPKALLNQTTMLHHAQTTFSTFFQHFASINARPDALFGVYQNIGDDSLDETLAFNMSKIYNSSIIFPWEDHPYIPKNVYRKLNTSRTVNATVSTRIEFLHMNDVATYLSLACLGWLLCTTLVVIALQRSYLSPLLGNIESLADVLVLVAGSDSLLKLVRERDPKQLVNDKEIMTRLGWFRGRDGRVRWGVEVVGDVGLGEVEWVDAPEDFGWDTIVRENSAKMKTMKERLGWVEDVRARFGF